MIDETAFCASNGLFHCHISGAVEEKSVLEEDFPHFLPLKEGGEGNPLICILLSIVSFSSNNKGFSGSFLRKIENSSKREIAVSGNSLRKTAKK